jgi:hypothetical protein
VPRFSSLSFGGRYCAPAVHGECRYITDARGPPETRRRRPAAASGRRMFHLARRGAAVTRRPGSVTRGALHGAAALAQWWSAHPGSPPRHITSMQHAAKGWLGTHFKDHLTSPPSQCGNTAAAGTGGG